MRIVETHLLDDKMDEDVTHYINTHQNPESVHVDANSLALNVQDDGGGRVLTVMHSQNFPPQMSSFPRQVSVGEQVNEGPWVEELLDNDGRLAALVAHLAQNNRVPSHHQTHPAHHKAPHVRGDVDPSVILDAPMRLFNGPPLDPQSDTIVVQVPSLPTLPPLQDMKRCPDTDWFNKNKNALKDESDILEQDQVLDIGTSPANKQSKKSLPHKKRISKKLKRSNEITSPQQDIVVINCNEPPQEEILPDSFAHEMRAMFICQLCGEFYGEEQLKFYHHLKQHYEPHSIIMENTVPDLGIDKMTNTCIVDNVPTLPDSIVELSLESSVPKTIYQPMDKHILYTTSEKTLNYTSNKLQYTMASMDKEVAEVEKNDLYDTLDKFEYFCTKCNKSFKKQKQCEAHIKEAHSNAKLEDMGEFSEPEDLMEGIHVAVEDGGEQYEPALLPHLTVDNGHVHQDHVRAWYMRNGRVSPLCTCGGAGYCAACVPHDTHSAQVSPHVSHEPPHVSHDPPHVSHEPPHLSQEPPVSHEPPHVPHVSQVSHVSPPLPQVSSSPLDPTPTLTSVGIQATGSIALASTPTVVQRSPVKDETLHRIFETESRPESFPPGPPVSPREAPSPPTKEKAPKSFECAQCGREFSHRNSLAYHKLMHADKQQVCRDCGKAFYTSNALKIHRRTHTDQRPYNCDECGRGFRQWGDLRYHKASFHSEKKNFKCDFCDKEFARRYTLSVHRRIHTGEKNYKCDYCNKSFRASSYRLVHMRSHTGNKPYKCPECEKGFRNLYDLQRHTLVHEKLRLKNAEQKKTKDAKDKNQTNAKNNEEKQGPKTPTKQKESENKLPILTSLLDKKQSKQAKKSQKKAPNVTVQKKVDGKFEEVVLETRQDPYKFKDETTPVKEFPVPENFSRFNRRDERELERLKTIKIPQIGETEERSYSKENTDGRMQVFTQVERPKEYNGPIVTNVVSLTELKNLEREILREPRVEIQGEGLENGFFERLSAFYNIPAV